MSDRETLIPQHGGYRNLKSFQIAQLIYDVTVRFCDRYIATRSRTHDQMVQAARSGVQNIAEGSKASATSKKMELKLTSVARASLEELRLDYEDFLRQRGMLLWDINDMRRQELASRRCQTADDVADWVKEIAQREYGRYGHNGQNVQVQKPIQSIKSMYPELAANAALVLIGVACSMLARQLERQAGTLNCRAGLQNVCTEYVQPTEEESNEGQGTKPNCFSRSSAVWKRCLQPNMKIFAGSKGLGGQQRKGFGTWSKRLLPITDKKRKANSCP